VGNILILVVDDELAVLTILQEMLGEECYQFLPALSLSDARELWKEHAGEIKLVITDLKLPDGLGSDLATTILNESPDVKVILITGLEPDCVTVPPEFSSRFFVFQKTSFVRDLDKKVSECLQEANVQAK
jgi:two-component system cell cycle sensor histidine kinase/response regulator CckA